MNSKKTKISKSKKNAVVKKIKIPIEKKFELSEAINSSYRIRPDIFLSYNEFLSKSLANFSDKDLRNMQRLFDHIKKTIIKNASKGELTTSITFSNISKLFQSNLSEDKIHLIMKLICFIFDSLGIRCTDADQANFTETYTFRSNNIVFNYLYII